MSLTVIGIIVMIVGFLGVIICAKLAKANPAMQPMAILSALVMIAGLCVYGVDYMGGGSSGNMEIGMIYQRSIGDAAGKYLKKAAPGKKVVFIVAPGASEGRLTKEVVSAMVAAYGSDIEVAELDIKLDDGEDFESVMKPSDIDKVVKANEADAYVLDIGMPSRLPSCISSNKGKKIFFLTGSGSLENTVMKRNLGNGNITAIITGKSGKRNPDFTPDEDELEAAFSHLYVIVDKANVNALD